MSNDRITIEGNILFGKPRIRGTRISVEQILACLAEGWNHEQIVQEFGLTKEDIQATMDFAYHFLSRAQFLSPSDTSHAEVSR